MLVCSAGGQPTPVITWLHHNNIIVATSRHVISTSGDQLEIKQFRNSDQGSYSCVADNRLGYDRRNFTVSINSE